MRFKLTADLCYISGLMHASRERELSIVGVNTSKKEIEEKFVHLILKLGAEPNKIMVEGKDGTNHLFVYHSKLARQCREIRKDEVRIFRNKNEFSSNYVAGMFDSSGHKARDYLYINGLSASDSLMLQNLGIHTKGEKILNPGAFIQLIKGRSVILDELNL